MTEGEQAKNVVESVLALRRVDPARPVGYTIAAVAAYSGFSSDKVDSALVFYLAMLVQGHAPGWEFGGALAAIPNRVFRAVDADLGFGDWSFVREAFFAWDEHVRLERTGKRWPDLDLNNQPSGV